MWGAAEGGGRFLNRPYKRNVAGMIMGVSFFGPVGYNGMENGKLKITVIFHF